MLLALWKRCGKRQCISKLHNIFFPFSLAANPCLSHHGQPQEVTLKDFELLPIQHTFLNMHFFEQDLIVLSGLVSVSSFVVLYFLPSH